MHRRRPSVVLYLVAFVLLAGLLAGCGGGDQSGNGAEKQGGGAEKQSGGEGQKGKASKPKIALGTVVFINPETERFTLRPSTEEQGKEPIVFRLMPKAQITLNDEEATLEDMEQGQQAQVEYVAVDGKNRARTVTLFSGG